MIKSKFLGISSPLPVLGKGGLSLLLTLCFSISLLAQTVEDPFPQVDARKYSMSMTIVCKVKMGGNTLKTEDNVTIAAYQGDEIRGKDVLADYSTQKNQYPDLCMLTIYGDKNNEPLHFKVAIGKRVIEVDPNIAYTINESYGSRMSPYLIELPEPIVTKPNNEGWRTVCLPFNARIPSDVTVYSAVGVKDNQLEVAKVEGSILPANTPVLVEFNPRNGSPEWLSCVAKSDVTIKDNILLGTTQPTKVAANSVFVLGDSDETGDFGFWLFPGTEIPAYQAYIPNLPEGVKGALIDLSDNIDGIEVPVISSQKRGTQTGWYDLNGREFKAKPTCPGVYINNGKKVALK